MALKNEPIWQGRRLPVLYTKSATGAISFWKCWVEGDTVVANWGQLNKEGQTARFRCEPKNVGRSNATTAEEQAKAEAVAKWQKQVKKKYYLSIEDADTAVSRKPMLAQDFKSRTGRIKYPVDVQPKLDGLRCLAMWDGDTVVLKSRGGELYDVEHIRKQLETILPKDEVFDGELYSHGVSLQTLNSWIRRPQVDSQNLQYWIYDIWSSDTEEWTSRARKLRQLDGALYCGVLGMKGYCSSIVVVPSKTISCESRVQEEHDTFVGQGFEGAIIRTHSGKYRFGYRSPDLLKLKAFKDDEFEIVGWEPGRGKFENVPIFKCRTACDKTFDVTPRGNSVERSRMLREADSYIGSSLTVRYFQLTPDGIPQFPVGVAVRPRGT